MDRTVNNCLSELIQTQKDKCHILSFVDARFESLSISIRKPRAGRLIRGYDSGSVWTGDIT